MTTEFDRSSLGPLLAETARAWRHRLDERLRPLGLSQAKWMALLHLAKRGDGITQKELAGKLGIESPTLVGLLDRMTADGWIRRRSSPADRRCKTVHLTPKSVEVEDEIERIAAALRHQLLAGIEADELATCMRVLSAIKHKAESIG